jgi:hypothetical protein
MSENTLSPAISKKAFMHNGTKDFYSGWVRAVENLIPSAVQFAL